MCSASRSAPTSRRRARSCRGTARPPLAWHVAADDRWHCPADEVAVRQAPLRGAPVFETRVRIPGGDAVQRVWSVADGGGLHARRGHQRLAAADRLRVHPPRRADRPAAGRRADRGHRAAGVDDRAADRAPLVGDGRARPRRTRRPACCRPGSPTADATARGWVARAERASRVVLPDERAAERLVAARAEVLLPGRPPLTTIRPASCWRCTSWCRLGELADARPRRRRRPTSPPPCTPSPAATAGTSMPRCAAAGAVLVARRARTARRATSARIRARPAEPGAGARATADGVRAVAAVERRLAADGVLLPAGIPDGVARRQSFEAHGLPIGPALDAVVRRALARRARRRAVGRRRRARRARPRRPSTRRGAPTAASGEALWRLAAPDQRRANSTRRWVNARSTEAPVSRWR